MAKESVVIDRPPLYVSSNWSDSVQIAAAGALTGLGVWLLTFLLQQFILNPVFCRTTDTASICDNGLTIAFGVATVAMAAISVALLARLDVFRPLLVSVAAAVTLWNLPAHLHGIQLFGAGIEQLIWTVVLYGLLFVLFAWLLRLRQFAVSLILMVLVVALMRWVVIS